MVSRKRKRTLKKAFTSGSNLAIVAIIVGGGLAWLGSSIENGDSLLGLGGALVAIGFAVLYVLADYYYCRNCGQRLGKLNKPRKCGRCDSNRIQKGDPGVGEAVRVKRR